MVKNFSRRFSALALIARPENTISSAGNRREGQKPDNLILIFSFFKWQNAEYFFPLFPRQDKKKKKAQCGRTISTFISRALGPKKANPTKLHN